MTFTTISADPNNVASIITAAHFNELLSALNAVRGANGDIALQWADILPTGKVAPAGGQPIYVEHITKVRDQMDLALQRLGLPTTAYGEQITSDTWIRASHVTELRSRAQ